MQVNQYESQLKDILAKANKILILIGGEPKADNIAAALALGGVLRSRGKITHFVSDKKIPENLSVISGADEFGRKPESKSLVISLDYEKYPVEKVSYKVENKRFNLILRPRVSLNLEEVQTTFSGGDYNLIIILGTLNLKESNIYRENKELFESLPTVNIDVDDSNERYGKLNIIDNNINSVSALVAMLLSRAEIKLSEKSANLLLLGMREATDDFSKVKGAGIFEAAAFATKAKDKSFEAGQGEENEESAKNLPSDWLSPKIYRSSKVS